MIAHRQLGHEVGHLTLTYFYVGNQVPLGPQMISGTSDARGDADSGGVDAPSRSGSYIAQAHAAGSIF